MDTDDSIGVYPCSSVVASVAAGGRAITTFAETRQRLEATYRRRTPKSAALYEQARRVLPGGDTRTTTFFAPYPIVVARAEGQYLYDVDGNALENADFADAKRADR